MKSEYELIKEAYESIKAKIPYEPEIAVVLGSGLGEYCEVDSNDKNKKVDAYIDYNEITNFPVSTVKGHKGRYVFMTVAGKKIVCMQGRVHHYEGYKTIEVVRPIRLFKLMGAKKLILTNAAGGVNKNFNVGDIMIIKDHISVYVPNPLIGKNIDEFGTRFPDMTSAYDKELIEKIKMVGKNNNIELKEGVYIQLSGPTYETPAEINLLNTIGVDATGMSTVVENIAANHMGLRVCGFSLITNKAAGYTGEKLSHEEVKMAADNAKPILDKLLTECIKVF